ncbi:SymE family type I addiction module toxin [Acerihabitans arboris]|uniref:Type I addiction module toxin, SymE family n=1 Tax=Acerihabitans arboris TaxID=2691583 RepID=A0A845SHU7_9GAMM|nr:SymE family type I addiction module toxin [Acerihabitans arboris]NDL62867.1 type I addiction module toxin, SymE family [Acerihabitans arboris]
MAKKKCKSEIVTSQAKVETLYYTVGYVPNGGKRNAPPALHIKGNWLHHCGFFTGQPVTITAKNGQLIINAELLV